MPWLEVLKRLARPGGSQPPSVYAGLRQQLLELPTSEHRARFTPVGDDLLAVLVELPVAKRHRATLVCVCDGTTSLYLSNGGGFIGVGEIPTVRTLARELLDVATNITASDRSQWEGRPSRTRNTRFDFVTTDGVVTGWADMERQLEESAFLRFVYVCAQKVITEIRVTQSAQTPAGR